MQENNYFSEVITGAIAAAVTWLGRWIFDLRRERSEAAKSEVELSDQVARIWRELSQDLEGKVKAMRAEMDIMKKEREELVMEIKNLRTENESLKKRVAAFIKKYGEPGH